MASSMRVAFAALRAGRPGRLPSPDEALAHAVHARRSRRALDVLPARADRRHARRACAATIERGRGSTAADEVMIATHAYDPAARLRSYELVASAFAA